MRKRLISALLSLSMIFSILPGMPAALADDLAWTGGVTGASFDIDADGAVSNLKINVGIIDTQENSDTYVYLVATTDGDMFDSTTLEDVTSASFDEEELGNLGTSPVGIYKITGVSGGVSGEVSPEVIYAANFSSTQNVDDWSDWAEDAEDNKYTCLLYIYNSSTNETVGRCLTSFELTLNTAQSVTIDEDGTATVTGDDNDEPKPITSVEMSGVDDSYVKGASKPTASIESISPTGSATITTNLSGSFSSSTNNETVTVTLTAAKGYIFDDNTSVSGTGWSKGTVATDGSTMEVSKTVTLTAGITTITSISASLADVELKKAVPGTGAVTDVKVNSNVNAKETTVDFASFSPTVTVGTNTYPAAGTIDYTGTFVVTAPDNFKFDETANYYTGSNTTVGSWTVTGVEVASGGRAATVSVKFDAIPLKVDSIALASGETAETVNKAESEKYTVTNKGLTVTYNDGHTGSITAANYASSGIIVDTSSLKNGKDDGTAVSTIQLDSTDIDSSGKAIYAVYDGSNPAASDTENPPKVQIAEVNVTHDLLGDTTVSAALPQLGGTIASVNTGTASPDTGLVEDNGVLLEWFTDASAQTAVGNSDKAVYGGTYYVKVTLAADDSEGYAFNVNDSGVGPKITLTDTVTSSDCTIETAAKTSTSDDNGGSIYAVYKVTMPAAPALTVVDANKAYDFYSQSSDKHDIVFTYDKGTVASSGLKIKKGTSSGDEVALASGDYSVDATNHKITINVAKLNSIFDSDADGVSNFTYVDGGTDWTLMVPFDNMASNTTSNGTFKVNDTTPYAKFTIDSGDGSVTIKNLKDSSTQTATKDTVYPLLKAADSDSKGYEYTVTAASGKLFTAWTGASTATTATITGDQTSGVHEYGATFSATSTLTVTKGDHVLTYKVEESSDGTSWNDATADTATDTWKIRSGYQYKITSLTFDTHYKADGFTKSSGTVTDESNQTSTYTFTAGTTDVAVTANAADAYVTLTLVGAVGGTAGTGQTAESGAVTFDVKKAGESTSLIPASSDSDTNTYTYHVYDDETYEVTSSLASGKSADIKLVATDTWKKGSDTITASNNTESVSSLGITADTTVTVNYAYRTLPSVSLSPSSYSPGTDTGNIVVTVNPGDYTFSGKSTITLDSKAVSASGELKNSAADSTNTAISDSATSQFDYKILNSDLIGLSQGSHTIAFGFSDSKTASGSFTISGLPAITAVTMGDNHAHGTNMGDFSITFQTAGTFTYKVSDAKWYKDNTEQTSGIFDDVKVTVTRDSSKISDEITMADFISNYITNKHMRYSANANDTKQGLVNGDIVTFTGTGSFTYNSSGGNFRVTQKTIDTTGVKIDKVYDGSAIAGTNGDYSLTINDLNSQLINDSASFIDEVSAPKVTGGKYKNSGKTADQSDVATDAPIVFTGSSATGADAGNYLFTASDAKGDITQRYIYLKSVAQDQIPHATAGDSSTYTGTVTSTNAATIKDANIETTSSNRPDTSSLTYNYSDTLASTETSSGIKITFAYDYAGNTSYPNPVKGDWSHVVITNITSLDNNYIVHPASSLGDAYQKLTEQTGTVDIQGIDKLEFDPASVSYYYTDKIDPGEITLKVTYKDASNATEYKLNATDFPTNVKLTWETAGGTAVDFANNVMTVPDYNGKKIVASIDTTQDTTSTASAANLSVTVNPLPINVTVKGTIEKTYDGDATFKYRTSDAKETNEDDTGTPEYSLALDKTAVTTALNARGVTAENQTAIIIGYKDVIGDTNNGFNLQASGAKIEFVQSDVYDVVYNETADSSSTPVKVNDYASIAVVPSGAENQASLTAQKNSNSFNKDNFAVSTTSNITGANIKQRAIKVSSITNIARIKKGNGTSSISNRAAAAFAQASGHTTETDATTYEALVTLDNGSGATALPDGIKNDHIIFTIKYHYDDDQTVTATNGANVTIEDITLGAPTGFVNTPDNKNGNYVLVEGQQNYGTKYTSEQLTTANQITGKGMVVDRVLKSIELTLPTKLARHDQTSTAMTYGDDDSIFSQGAADYAGLKVSLTYEDDNGSGTEVRGYEWKEDGGSYKWVVTDENSSSDTSPVTTFDASGLPFNLTWSNGDIESGTVAVTADPMLWTADKNGRTMTASDKNVSSISAAKTIYVNKKEIKVNAVYNNGTEDVSPTKNYDGDTDIKPTGTWKFSLASGESLASVDALDTTGGGTGITIGTDKKVEYISKNVEFSGNDVTSMPLKFGALTKEGSDWTGADVDNFNIALTDGYWTSEKANRAASYIVTEVTGTNTGTINQRPLTLTGIIRIPETEQLSGKITYSENTTIPAYAQATEAQTKAEFAENEKANDDNGDGTGIVGTENVTIVFDYKYNDDSLPKEIEETTNLDTSTLTNGLMVNGEKAYISFNPSAIPKLSGSDIDKNYVLGELTTTSLLHRTGKINGKAISGISITKPDIFGRSATDVQYGDKFSYDGLKVTITYTSSDPSGTPPTVEYIPKVYTSDDVGKTINGATVTADQVGDIKSWTKSDDNAEVALADIPFAFDWTSTEKYKEGDPVNIETGNKMLSVLIPGGAGSLAIPKMTPGLVAGPRQVNVTAEKKEAVDSITKPYDGTTAYTGDDIELKVEPAQSTYATSKSQTYTLPDAVTATSTGAAFDDKNATDGTTSGAQKVVASGIALSVASPETASNYTLGTANGEVAASITKRDVYVKQINYVNAVTQGQTGDALKGTLAVATGTDDTAAIANIDQTNIKKNIAQVVFDNANNHLAPATGDVVEITYSFEYANATAADNAVTGSTNADYKYQANTNVTVKDFAAVANSATAKNYNINALDEVTGKGTVLPGNPKVEIKTLPTVLKDGDYTFGTPYSGDGLVVNVSYGGDAGTDYVLKVEEGTEKWYVADSSGNKTGEALATAPVTLTIVQNDGTTVAAENTKNGKNLTPAAYNGGKIVAALADDANVKGDKEITVNKAKITTVTPSTEAAITKTYDGTDALPDSANIKYTVDASQILKDENGDVVMPKTIKADAAFESAHVSVDGNGDAQAQTITFKNFAFTEDDPNYILDVADKTSDTNVTGTITKKAVTVSKVYVPSVAADPTAENPVTGTYTATSYTTTGTTASPSQVIVDTNANFVGNEGYQFDFNYGYSYAANVVKDTAGSDKTVSVADPKTITPKTGTTVQATDYTVTWPAEATGETVGEAEYITKLEITGKDLTYTHGDKLDTQNMADVEIKITKTTTPETSYKIVADNGSYKWSSEPETAGLTVTLETPLGGERVDISTTEKLQAAQAHYTKMNGDIFVVRATGTGATEAKDTSHRLTVNQRQLALADTTVVSLADRYYNGTDTADLSSQATLKTLVTTGDIAPQTFKGAGEGGTDYDDVVSIEISDAKYSSADVEVDASSNPTAKTVTYTATLTGADADNYIIPANVNVTGKIKPLSFKIKDISETIPDAIYLDNTNPTGTLVNVDKSKYTTDTLGTEWNGIDTPAVDVPYKYDTSAAKDDAPVTIAKDAITLTTPSNNFIVTNDAINKTGKVTLEGIKGIQIKLNDTATKYFGDTIDLTKLEITVTTASGENTFNYGVDDEGTTKVNPLMEQYGLKLQTISLDYVDTDSDNQYDIGEALKYSPNGQIYVQVGNDGISSNRADVPVNKRKLVVNGTLNKEYDGTKYVSDASGLKLASAQGSGAGEGLAAVDSAKLTGDTTIDKLYTVSADASALYYYSDATTQTKNVGTNLTINSVGNANLALTNAEGTYANQYELELGTVTGSITAKAVTLTPVIGDVKAATPSDSGTKVVNGDNKGTYQGNSVTANGFVGAEEYYYTLAYDVTLTNAQWNSTNEGSPYTFANTAYNHSEVSASADYPASNYEFTWAQASVKVVGNSGVDRAEIIQSPDDHIKLAYDTNDTIDLTKLKVSVYYKDSETPVTTTSDTSIRTAGYTIYFADDTNKTPIGADYKVKETDNGRFIKVKINESLETSNTTYPLSVTTPETIRTAVRVTAELKDSPTSRPYDGTTQASMFVNYKFVNFDADVAETDRGTISTDNINGITANFETANAGNDKPIIFDTTNIGVTDLDTLKYKVEWVAPDTLDADVTKLHVKVSKVSDNAENAILGVESTKTGTITGTTNYTIDPTNGEETAWTTLGTKPQITVPYTYDDINTAADNVDVPIDKTTDPVSKITFTNPADENNFELEQPDDLKIKGNVVGEGIIRIDIDGDGQSGYFGDKLDLKDLKVKVYTSAAPEGNEFDYYSDKTAKTVNPLFTSYQLELANDGIAYIESTFADGVTLKASEGHVYVKTSSSASRQAESNKLNVTTYKRKLTVTGTDIDKVYDGDNKVTAATLEIAATQGTGTGEGFATINGTADEASNYTVTVATPSALTYPDKNADTDAQNITGNAADAGIAFANAASGQYADQYEAVLGTVTGKITPKTVKITPHIATINKATPADTGDKEITGTVVDVDGTDSFVGSEGREYNFSYTAKLSHDEWALAEGKTSPFTRSHNNDSTDYTTQYSGTVTAGAMSSTYPLSNYDFQWQTASIAVGNTDAVIESAEIVQSATNHMQTVYTAGDKLNLAGTTGEDTKEPLKVSVKYQGSDTPVEYTYGTANWPSNFKVYFTSDQTTALTGDTVLSTTDNGKYIKVEVRAADTGVGVTQLVTSNEVYPLIINDVPKIALKVTAARNTTASRAYDATDDASMFVNYVFTDASLALIEDADKEGGVSTGAVDAAKLAIATHPTAVFQDNATIDTDTNVKASYAHDNKPITYKDVAVTLTGDSASKYTVEWEEPATALTANVTKLAIKIASVPADTERQINSDITEPETVNVTDRKTIGTSASYAVVLDKTDTESGTVPSSAARMPQVDQDKFRATYSYTIPANVLNGTSTDDNDKVLTLINQTVYEGSSDKTALFTTNYDFTWPTVTITTTDEAVTRTIVYDTTSELGESVHSKDVNYDGMKFSVSYGKGGAYQYEYDKDATNKDKPWKRTEIADIARGTLDNSTATYIALDEDGIKLYWNSSDGVQKSEIGKAQYSPIKRSILIEAPHDKGDTTTSTGKAYGATGPVTVKPLDIYVYVKSDTVIEKVYDGTDAVNPSALQFEFYEKTGETTYTKYVSPTEFGTEDFGLNMDILEAKYAEKANSTRTYRGKDVYYNDSNVVDEKPISLNKLRLTGEDAASFNLVNGDGDWALHDITSGFTPYTGSEDGTGTPLSNNNLKGKITPKAMTVTFVSAPSVQKDDTGTAKTVDLRAGTDWTTDDFAEGDTYDTPSTSALAYQVTYTGTNTEGSQTLTPSQKTGHTSDVYPNTNYQITTTNTTVSGSVSDKFITGIVVTGPDENGTDTEGNTIPYKDYEHKDKFNPKGMTVTVYYAGEAEGTTYTFDMGENDANKDKPWVNGTTRYASIPDVNLTWGSTSGTAVAVADYNASLSYVDANKGYGSEINGRTKNTRIVATATLNKASDNTDKASDSSDIISISKKQIYLSMTGAAEKIYDSDNLVKSTGMTSKNVAVAVLDKNGAAIPPADGISYKLDDALAAGKIVFKSTDSKKDSYAGDKKIDFADAAAISATYLTLDDEAAYILPNASQATSTATGKITPRELTISSAGPIRLNLTTNPAPTPNAGETNKYDIDVPNVVNNPGFQGNDPLYVYWKATVDSETGDAVVPTSGANATIKLRDGSTETGLIDNYTPTFSYTGETKADVVTPAPGVPTPTMAPTPTPRVEIREATPHPTYTPYPTYEPLPTYTPYPTREPLPTYTPYPTREPLPTYTPLPTNEPVPTFTPMPTAYPTPDPTAEPTPEPSATPLPTEEPSPTPTIDPTDRREAVAIEILTQPKFVIDALAETPLHGDTVAEAGDLDNFTIKVTYNDGTEETESTYVYDGGKWNEVAEDGTFTELEGLPKDVAFNWDNTDEPLSTDKQLRHDNENTITASSISHPDASDVTEPVDVDQRHVRVKASGTPTKMYDGTVTIEDQSSIAYTVEGQIAQGDNVTASATAEFADVHVAEDGVSVVFKDVVLDNDNYVVDPYSAIAEAEDALIENIKGVITKRPLQIKIVAPPKTVSSSAALAAVNPAGVSTTYSATLGSFSLTDESNSIIEGDTVTITYAGAYESISTAGVNRTVNITEGPTIDGNETAITDYEIELASAAGTVNSASTGGGGGGGGGGSTNALNITYENADGTISKSTTKLSVPSDSDSVTLTATFTKKISDPTVIWTSSDESIVKVDENGVVTFVGEGTATVTAQSKTNKQLKDTISITVTEPAATASPAPTEKPSSGSNPTPTPEPTPGYDKKDSLITKTMLNPYIVGYDDNVFGPELPISREELATIFARLIANSIYMDQDYDTSFPDVPEKWSKPYIGYLEGFNVVTGYEDGTFRPENFITRAEMAVMMAKAEGYDISGYLAASETGFPDVDEGYSAWGAKAIKIMSDMEIMEGYEDGTFRPSRPITRAETVATVNRVLADMEVADYEVLPSDVTDAHWAYNDIVFAMNHRILKDAAADPNRFIWSEQFDENMVINTEAGEEGAAEAGSESAEDEKSSSEDASAENSDAVAPETKDETTETDAQTEN